MWDSSRQNHSGATHLRSFSSVPYPTFSFEAVATLIAAVVVVSGLAVLLGWLLEVDTLKSVVPGLATMKPNTAICFILAGASLFTRLKFTGQKLSRYGTVGAGFVLLICGLTMLQYLTEWELGIDNLVISSSDEPGDISNLGRMAPLSALNFVLLSVALILIDRGGWRPVEDSLVLIPALASVLALVGYIYDVSSFYSVVQYASVALHTAILTFALASGILFARPKRGLMAIISSHTTGGIMVRRLLPASLILLIVLGWLRLMGQRMGLYNAEFGLSLLIVTMIVIFSLLILWIGAAISRLDEKRQTAERLMRDSEETYRLLFETNPHPMWVYDVKTLAFLAVNDAAVAHYGYSEAEFLSMTIADIRPVEDVPLLMDAVRTLTPEATTKVMRRHKKKDGTVIDVEGSSRELSFLGRRARLVLASDVTERRRLEDQVRQSQKMEAVGRLAGGVAHDFNNLLTAIIGYSEIVLSRLGDLDPLRREVEEIEKAGKRAADLTTQLLAFSRRQVLQPRVLNLNAVIADLSKMIRRLLGEDIELVTELSFNVGAIKADPGQIEQVIMNLALNARDAMPNGGRIAIETRDAILDEKYAESHFDVTSGSYVQMSVSDTGAGMDSQTVAQVFEPFFTTKEKGRGTGLGLSTVYGIVKQSCGHIAIDSVPGKGTRFDLYFPKVEDQVDGQTPPPTVVDEFGGSETILVVEDESIVRKLAREILQRSGYVVLEAANGGEAMQIFQQPGTTIDLLITDVVMPGISGRELAGELETAGCNYKVLFMSGYTDDAIVRHGILDANIPFVQKPFTPRALLKKVREVLDSPSR
jgi:PAS domain S-box-containing protein